LSIIIAGNYKSREGGQRKGNLVVFGQEKSIYKNSHGLGSPDKINFYKCWLYCNIVFALGQVL